MENLEIIQFERNIIWTQPTHDFGWKDMWISRAYSYSFWWDQIQTAVMYIAVFFWGIFLRSLCVVWVGHLYWNPWILIGRRSFLEKVTPTVPSKQHVCQEYKFWGIRIPSSPTKHQDCQDTEDQPQAVRSMDYEHDLIFLKEIGSSATQPGVLRSTWWFIIMEALKNVEWMSLMVCSADV